MGHKVKIGNEIKDIKGGKVLINGEVKDIKGGKVLINGKVKDIKFGTPIGEFAAGTSVYTKINGVKTELFVANQGKPGISTYDDSFNGTWTMLRDIYTMDVDWRGCIYQYSTAAEYLDNTFTGLLEPEILAKIKTVNFGDDYTTKAFLPSASELGVIISTDISVGGAALLSYFEAETAGEAAEKRVAYYAGAAGRWYIRAPCSLSSGQAQPYYINTDGWHYSSVNYLSKGIRPIMIFDSEETLVDDDYNIIT